MIKIIFSTLISIIALQSVAQEARVYKKNQKYGLLRADNQPATLAIYDQISPGVPYSIVKRYDTNTGIMVAGCIDETGGIVIPLQYTDLKIEGLQVVACRKIGNRFVYGLISIQNEIIIPLQYLSIKSLGTLRYAAENELGKKALFSETGIALTDFDLDAINTFKKDMAVYELNGLLGLVNRDGRKITAPEFNNISIDNEGNVKVIRPNEWTWINSLNKIQQVIHADTVSILTNDTYLIKKRNGCYLADETLMHKSNTFASIKPSENPSLMLVSNGGNMGVINLNGELVLSLEFSQIKIDNNFIYAYKNSGWQIFSLSGKLLNTRSYSSFTPASYFTFVNKNNYWGAVDASGKEIIACVYDTILQSNYNQLVVRFKEKYGIISRSENWLLAPQNFLVQLVGPSCYLLQDANLFTLKDFAHKILYFTNNTLRITDQFLYETTSLGEIWQVSFTGIVTKLQQKPIESVSLIHEEKEGYRAIKKNGKWGFVDALGRLRIANRYDAVKDFSEGLAAFSILKKWGFLNHNDEIVIHPAYEDVTEFANGLSIVKQKGLYGILSSTNEIVLPCRYNSIERIASGYFQLQSNGLYGLASSKGILQYEPKYSSQQQVGNAIIVERNNKFGVILANNINVLPMMYNFINSGGENSYFLTMTFGKVENLKL